MSTPLKLLFPIFRANHFSTLGPVIDAAAKDPDVDPEIILMQLPGSAKGGLLPGPSVIPDALKERVPFRILSTSDEVADACGRADAVVSIGMPSSILSGRPKPEGSIWCTVYDSSHNCMHRGGPRVLADLYFWPTRYFLDWAVDLGLATLDALEPRSRFVGYMRTDYLKMTTRPASRRDWGIDPDKPTVLFIPDPFLLRSSSQNIISPWYFNLWLRGKILERVYSAVFQVRSFQAIIDAFNLDLSYRALLKSVRLFCDRNNAGLVLFPRRRKDWDGDTRFSREELDIADHVIEKTEYFPQTMMKAVQMADLVISPFFSEAIMDGTSAGIPYLSLKLPEGTFFPMGKRAGKPLYNHTERFGHRADFSGVSWYIPPREFISNLPHWPFSRFSIQPNAQEQFFNKFTGPADGHCGEKVVNEIKSYLRNAAA